MTKRIRQVIGAIATLAATFVFVGCQQQMATRPAAPAAPAAERTAPAIAAPAAPKAPSTASINAGLITLSKSAPAEVGLGEEYTYTITALANESTGQVTVMDMIPAGTTFVRSLPEARRDGGMLAWVVPQMEKGESQTFAVTVRADREGSLQTCSSVVAVPRICTTTLVGRPVLNLTKAGPATATINTDVNYNIVVTNVGTTVARNVIVTDAVPAGMSHASGNRTVTFNAGDLAPNQSATFPITLRAVERGRHCNTAEAVASNAGRVAAEACTTVLVPGLAIEKSGDAERFINRQANYRIVVTNTGDTTLTGVVVTDTAPAETSIVAAPGAAISGNTATWTVGELASGSTREFSLTLTSARAGRFCNSVTVASNEGLRDSSQACTTWIGVTGILLEKRDDPDPIQIGETTTLTASYTNQGTIEITNAQLVIDLPAELDAVSASGGGRIDGKRVTFPVTGVLAPKQKVEFTVTARGVRSGDARTKFVLRADNFRTPVTAEESTTVY